MEKNPNMFVRTHFVYYFVSLLLADILQGGFLSCAPPLLPRALGLSESFLAVVGWFMSPLLLSDSTADISCRYFAAIGGIINSTWIRQQAVTFGSLCTAQGN